MTKRKTIKVEELVEMANNFMLNSDDKEDMARLGVASFIESVLCRTNRYNGFQYLGILDMKKSLNGKTPGIVWEYLVPNVPTANDKPTFPDLSRRRYYLSSPKK